MARIAVAGTFSANGAHTAGHAADPGTTGHVFISFDNTVLLSFSDFRQVVMSMLKVFEGSSDFARK